jgi:bile acid:Na+ symporter, BASS family
MGAAGLIRLVLTASILLLVFALGLRANLEHATYLFRRPARLLRGFLAMAVAVPVMAAALAALVHLDPAVEIALLLMAVSPIPPILPAKLLDLGGRSRYVFGLLVAASLIAIVVVPLAIEVLGWVFRREAHIGAGVVARVVGVTVLLPLATGLVVRRVAPLAAERVAPGISRIGNVLLLTGLVTVLLFMAPAIVTLIGNGTILIIAAIVGTGLLAGHWLGGPDPDDRTALAIASSTRHPGVALAIARLNFPEETRVPAAIFLFLLVNALVTLPYGVWRRRERTARAVDGQ